GPPPGGGRRLGECRRRARPRQGLPRGARVDRRTPGRGRVGVARVRVRRQPHGGDRAAELALGRDRRARRTDEGGRGAARLRRHRRLEPRAGGRGRRVRRRRHRRLRARQGARHGRGRVRRPRCDRRAGRGARRRRAGGPGVTGATTPLALDLTSRVTGALTERGIPSPPENEIHLGPFPLRAYALAIIVGAILAWWILDRRYTRKGGPADTAVDIALYWMVPFGIVGSRI